MFDLN